METLVGVNKIDKYEILFSPNFDKSLIRNIDFWRELEIPEEKITKYIQNIFLIIKTLEDSPYQFPVISNIYNFDSEIRRVKIGKNYAIFFKIDEMNKKIIIGSFYNQKQMNIKF
jgi:mRNA-degrading endonuclease RelE of RelBE toxin-antitoxin system